MKRMVLCSSCKNPRVHTGLGLLGPFIKQASVKSLRLSSTTLDSRTSSEGSLHGVKILDLSRVLAVRYPE